MSEKDSLHGLTCPNCGGVVPIPEGQLIVKCPYCELRSFVRGERGLRRYQVPQQVNRAQASGALRQFFSSNLAIARDAPRQAKLTESFLVYLPFWAIWGRVAGWVLGQKRVRRNDRTHYEPREVRVVQEITWNGAACDVGEFGVNQAPLGEQPLEPFEPERLHANGLVFEPVGAFGQAKAAAESQFLALLRKKAGLDRISQEFARLFRSRFGLVYYPLWVLRYQYRGRAFQVVVDGYSGKVLYGKAPGNTLFRAAMLVGGMAVGSFLALDVPALILSQANRGDSDGIFGIAAIVFLVGLGIMGAAYRAFRYGEQYEYRSGGAGLAGSLDSLKNLTAGLDLGTMSLGNIRVKDVEQWIDRLS